MKGSVWPRPFEKDPTTGVRRPVKGSTWTFQFATPKAGGGRRFITKGGFPTKRAAEAALAEALADHGRSPTARVEPSKMALVDYLEQEWLPTLHGLKPSTRKGYADLVSSYVAGDELAHVRLCDVTAGQLAKFYDRVRTSGRKRPRPDGSRALSESTVHHLHVAMSASLGHAVESGLLRVNPVSQIPKKARPKVSQAQRPEMAVWSADEAMTFLKVCAGDRLGPLFDLALNTGMRRGELLGLRWADVDLERSTVAVRRNRVIIGSAVDDGTPKSGRARTVDLDPATLAMLKAHRRAQLEERMAWGEAWTDSGLVFTQEDGTALHPQTTRWHIGRLARKAGVPVIRTHDLRHTHATLGLAAGVPVKVMQERLGHASAQITQDLYSHVIPGMQADAASKIGALLRGVS